MTERPRTDHLRPWQPGDPVGMGEVYLPTKKHRAAYHAAIVDQSIDEMARHVIGLPDLDARRRAIAAAPEWSRDRLRERIKELWDTK